MANNLITIKFDEQTIESYKLRFQKKYKEKIIKSLNDIRQEWQQEFVRQDARNQGTWKPLKTWVSHRTDSTKGRRSKKIDNESYYARKLKAYRSGKRMGGEVRYLRVLKRSGIMLDRYINGIRVNNTDYTVTIPYPRSPDVNLRAKVHQGEPGYKLPFGVLATRPYDLERFKFTADREIRRALS